VRVCSCFLLPLTASRRSDSLRLCVNAVRLAETPASVSSFGIMATSPRKFTARYYLLTSKATDETPSASPTPPTRSRASQTAAASCCYPTPSGVGSLSTNAFVHFPCWNTPWVLRTSDRSASPVLAPPGTSVGGPSTPQVTGKGGLRRKNKPEKQKKTATKPQAKEGRAGLLLKKRKREPEEDLTTRANEA
jgi:hypothetical protein